MFKLFQGMHFLSILNLKKNVILYIYYDMYMKNNFKECFIQLARKTVSFLPSNDKENFIWVHCRSLSLVFNTLNVSRKEKQETGRVCVDLFWQWHKCQLSIRHLKCYNFLMVHTKNTRILQTGCTKEM